MKSFFILNYYFILLERNTLNGLRRIVYDDYDDDDDYDDI